MPDKPREARLELHKSRAGGWGFTLVYSTGDVEVWVVPAGFPACLRGIYESPDAADAAARTEAELLNLVIVDETETDDDGG